MLATVSPYQYISAVSLIMGLMAHLKYYYNLFYILCIELVNSLGKKRRTYYVICMGVIYLFIVVFRCYISCYILTVPCTIPCFHLRAYLFIMATRYSQFTLNMFFSCNIISLFFKCNMCVNWNFCGTHRIMNIKPDVTYHIQIITNIFCLHSPVIKIVLFHVTLNLLW